MLHTYVDGGSGGVCNRNARATDGEELAGGGLASGWVGEGGEAFNIVAKDCPRRGHPPI